MKKKYLKMIAAVSAILLIISILFIYNAFCGNIFSAMYAKGQIEKYIDKTYPNNDYEISDAVYNYKFSEYYCQITDPNSEDGSFTATYGDDGIISDSYTDVTSLDNTLMRLEDGFRKDVEPILDRYFKDEDEFGFGTIIEGKNIDKSKLKLDMKFDPKNMPIDTYIVASFKSAPEKTLGRIQEIAKDLKALGYRIDYYVFFDDGNYFEYVPTEELLKASEISELTKYTDTDNNNTGADKDA